MQETPYPVTKRRASAGRSYTVPRRPAYTDTTDDDDNLYDYPQTRTGRSAIRYDVQTDQADGDGIRPGAGIAVLGPEQAEERAADLGREVDR